jgi:integrase
VKVKLTEKFVDSLQPPKLKGKQEYYWDTVQPGLGVRVTYANAKNPAGDRTYVVQVSSGPHAGTRRMLGKVASYSVQQARDEARTMLGNIAKGEDPLQTKQHQRLAVAVTLKQVFDTYIENRELKPRTQYDYKRLMKTYLLDWNERPMLSITRSHCADKHAEIGKRSKGQANYSMRLVGALFEYAIVKYQNEQTGVSLIPFNPVPRAIGKGKLRQWFKIGRKDTWVHFDQMAAWYKAVMELESDAYNGQPDVVRDYLLTIMFTGMRRGETERLLKTDVDFKGRVLFVPEASTKGKRRFALPLTNFHLEILRRRADANPGNAYLFPGTGTGRYMVEPKKQVNKIIAASGVKFSPHDLRRTYTTAAESLDLSEFALKQLLNHAYPDSQNVTGGYVMLQAERLREPMERVVALLLNYAGVKPKRAKRVTAKVVSIKRAA